MWALASSSDESLLVSGGADSMITLWQDSSEEEARSKETERQVAVLRSVPISRKR